MNEGLHLQTIINNTTRVATREIFQKKAASKRQSAPTVIAGNVDESVEAFALAQRLDDFGVETFDKALHNTEFRFVIYESETQTFAWWVDYCNDALALLRIRIQNWNAVLFHTLLGVFSDGSGEHFFCPSRDESGVGHTWTVSDACVSDASVSVLLQYMVQVACA